VLFPRFERLSAAKKRMQLLFGSEEVDFIQLKF